MRIVFISILFVEIYIVTSAENGQKKGCLSTLFYIPKFISD